MISFFSNTEIAFRRLSTAQLWKSFILFKFIQYPFLSSVGKQLITASLRLRLPIKPILKTTLFEQFVGGEDIDSCERTIDQLFHPYKVGSILDYAVEGNETESSFEKAKNKIIDTILLARKKEAIPFSVFKISAITSIDELEQHQKLSTEAKKRIDQILNEAKKSAIPILIDAEESWIQNPVDQIAIEEMQYFNHTEPLIYNTLQCYRKDALSRLKQWSSIAQNQNFKLGVKLVRGAYLEKENARARSEKRTSPICESKSATDEMFNSCMEFCLRNVDHIHVIIASHNEDSFYRMIQLMKELEIHPSDRRVFTAQLYGMSDHLTFNLIHYGHNTVKYVTFGPLRKVLPYLFRRADENTSVLGQSSRELRLIRQELRRRRTV